MPISRRQSLQWFAVAGVALSQAGKSQSASAETGDAGRTIFRHGVASGDPDQQSVVLWTRVTTDAENESVQWAIASDPEFRSIVGQGEAVASSERDHTLKIVAEGLEPGATYYYHFTTTGETSPVGRTKTLPTGPVERWGIALASCSNYPFGYFNAYDAIAKDEAVDLVLHTGDYIYEYGADEWGDQTGKVLNRRHDPPHEIVTLDDYRRRHAQYKSDAGSRAMLAAHPLIAFWDDHETTNNPWTGGAGNHEPETEGDWTARRDASLKAYFEWMPIRDPAPGQALHEYWRTYSFGDLATLITLETRHTARGKQVEYPDFDAAFQARDDRDRFMTEVMGDPSRKMLSAAMEEHLRAGLAASVEAGQPWRLIGNASPMARMPIPDLIKSGIERAEIPPDGEYLIPLGQWNLPWYSDTWDGYAAAREAFYQLAREAGAQDLLVLTGDSHSFWANQLFNEAGEPLGVEVGTAGISSPSDLIDAGFNPEVVPRIDAVFAEGMDEVRWTDSMHQGYVRVVLSPNAADVTYVGVDTVLSHEYRTLELRKERVVKPGPSLAYA
jgi:alkaline phosphatase D